MTQTPDPVDRAASHQILVVDDEEIVLVALRETLVRQGYHVVATSSAPEAIELLRRQTFAVVLTDHQMPETSGLELLAHARQLQPDATRILITAVLNLTTVIASVNKGEVYRFIIKPWMREELLVTVSNAVQRYELICKNNVLQATLRSLNERLVRLNEDLEHQVGEASRENQRLTVANQSLGRSLVTALELCLRSVEPLYPVMTRRAQRVRLLCRAMADGSSLSTDQRQALELAGWLHDLGLVGLPPELVNRWEQAPPSLTATEQASVQRHPVLGQELTCFAEPFQDVGPAIRAHHEHFDGTGYPDGLAGERIPWLGRLLAVAVAHAADTGGSDATLEAIRQGAGTRFDPQAVDALVRALPKSGLPEPGGWPLGHLASASERLPIR